MGFHGQVVTIPLGQGGLHSDDPETSIPISDLILAKNVQLGAGLIEKDFGSKPFNQSLLGASISAAAVRAFYDWWPNDSLQLVIAVDGNGRVWMMPDGYNQTLIDGAGTAACPTLLNPSRQIHMVAGGSESIGRPRKLFILTGLDVPQVLSGVLALNANGSRRSAISGPAADWSGSNQPSFMLPHRGRMLALGNANDPHRVYVSDDDSHEDFTQGVSYPVYPGEGEKLFSALSYKDVVYLFKYPKGVYYIDDSNPNVEQWTIGKISESFGAASAHPACEIINDLLVANATGSITSLSATAAFGNVKAGDVLNNLRVEQYMRRTTSPNGNLDRWALFYEDKKKAYFTYRSSGGSNNDRILILDMSGGPNVPARVTWSEKDQPNCLGLVKDIYGVPRPFYGTESGYIMSMEEMDREVNGAAFRGEFQLPHLDFAAGDPARSETKKIFKFLELTFEPTGRWNVYIETYVDGKLVQTIPYQVSKGAVLGDFNLGRSRLTDRTPRSIMKKLYGSGRRISFRVYNEGYRENYRLLSLKVYFKYAGQSQDESGEDAEA